MQINATRASAGSFVTVLPGGKSMRARDVMARTVVTVTPETTVEEAAQLMINHRISGIPVVDGDRGLVGIVTEGDLLRRAETGTERRPRGSGWFSLKSRLAAEYVKTHAKRVGDVMTPDVFTVDELTSLADIADLLESKQIKRVPVIHDGRVAGIVSRADLLKIVACGGISDTDEDRDRVIRERLFAELRRQKWANPTEENIIVSDGVVHLWGLVGSEAERTALRVAAENIENVRGIEDHTILASYVPAI
jgi:CBS-domain-containing membrane protein